MLDTREVKDKTALAAFASFLQLPTESTRPSVLGATLTHLRLFDSALARRVTASTSFDLDAFIEGEPMSLYLIVPPIRLSAYRPILRLWVTGLIMSLTQRKKPPKERTLMLVDGAGNLGQIDALLTAATLLRSSGFTIWSFFQNAAQLQITALKPIPSLITPPSCRFSEPRTTAWRKSFPISSVVSRRKSF